MSRRNVLANRLRGYDVSLVEGLAQKETSWWRETIGERRTLVVTTPTVASLHAASLRRAIEDLDGRASLHVLRCDEPGKTLEAVVALCEEAKRLELDRRAVLVGFGGGVCTAIVTMSASWIRRGIDYVKVPTTLIGLVDAGIGIKGAVNFEKKKSYLGCFYPPESVLLDPSFIETLPVRHIRSGLAEIIKTALLCDRRLFELVEQHWQAYFSCGSNGNREIVRETVWRSAVRLLEDLEKNLYEDRGQERAADLGHTFSPILESATDFALAHGEAVAVDLALSCELAVRIGCLKPASRDRIIDVLKAVGLPIWHPALTQDLCVHALEEAARHRSGRPNLVLPIDLGEIAFVRELHHVPLRDLRASIQALGAAS